MDSMNLASESVKRDIVFRIHLIQSGFHRFRIVSLSNDPALAIVTVTILGRGQHMCCPYVDAAVTERLLHQTRGDSETHTGDCDPVERWQARGMLSLGKRNVGRRTFTSNMMSVVRPQMYKDESV